MAEDIDGLIDAGSLTTAAQVYAAHTAWQIAQSDAASSLDYTKVIRNAAVADATDWTNAGTYSGEQYTGAPDAYFIDNYGAVMDAYQTVYGLPAGKYQLKVATRADTGNFSKVYVKSGDTEICSARGEHVGNGSAEGTADDGELGNGWSWTYVPFEITSTTDVVIGFYKNAVSWAGADDFKLTYRGTAQNVLGKSEAEAIADARTEFLTQMPAVGDDGRDFSFFIHNPEATTSTQGWTVTRVDITSGESYNYQNSDPKNTYFDRWNGDTSATSTAEQTVTNLPAGNYVLSAMLRGTTSTMSIDLEASTESSQAQQTIIGTGNTGDLGDKGWHEVTLDALTLNEGESLTIRLTATGTKWWSADHFTLTWSPLDDPTVGITTIGDEAPAQGRLYDLQGRRLNTPTRSGIYIRDGKKYAK